MCDGCLIEDLAGVELATPLDGLAEEFNDVGRLRLPCSRGAVGMGYGQCSKLGRFSGG